MRETIYIVASVPGERARIAEALAPDAFDLRVFDAADALLACLDTADVACVVAPIDLPGGVGIRGLVHEVRARGAGIAVVVIGRDDDLQLAVNLVRSGVTEYVEAPMNNGRLRAAVHRAVAAVRIARSHSRQTL